MVNPIQGANSGGMMPQAWQAKMTENQKSSFAEIISRYDPKNFSQTDFKAMGDELQQAGIGRTHEVKTMLEAAGFNIDQYLQGGPGGMQRPNRPPPAQGQGGVDVQALQTLMEILDNYDLTNISSEDQDNLMNDLTNSGLIQQGVILDIMA